MQVDNIFWLLLGNVLYNPEPDKQQQAAAILRNLYVEKSRKMELHELYTTNKAEYNRLRDMPDAEYADRLRAKYTRTD